MFSKNLKRIMKKKKRKYRKVLSKRLYSACASSRYISGIKSKAENNSKSNKSSSKLKPPQNLMISERKNSSFRQCSKGYESQISDGFSSRVSKVTKSGKVSKQSSRPSNKKIPALKIDPVKNNKFTKVSKSNKNKFILNKGKLDITQYIA